MKLSDQATGSKVVIVKVKGHGSFRKRIIEMGFVKGKIVEVIKNAPLRDPIEYEVMGYKISLRKSEAALIEVADINLDSLAKTSNYQGVIETQDLPESIKEKQKVIHVALVGNPNSGKTTIFNTASGAREHVGNYSGVTVGAKQGSFTYKAYNFVFTDLPGTYSLSAFTPEELFVRHHIIEEHPDIVLNVVVASNLERNLYLTSQLIDMDLRVVVALNMYDELEKNKIQFDHHQMGNLLGIPFVPTVGSRGEGMHKLFDELIKVYEGKHPTIKHIHINYGQDIEPAIEQIQTVIKESPKLANSMSPRFLSVKLLEKDKDAEKIIEVSPHCERIKAKVKQGIEQIENNLLEDAETAIIDAKYGFITGALRETFKDNESSKKKLSDAIDTILTHKYLGFPIFAILMFLVFTGTFVFGAYPQEWLSSAVDAIGGFINTHMQAGILKDLLVQGIVGGVGSVIVFVPNILILYFFIAFMEGTGYMARAAFIMDKIMHKMGLHGRSFIPLLMGFGCNVPAILATRTIEGHNNRLITILINPLMSCTARLMVYLLFAQTFFPEHVFIVVTLIYLLGIVLAVIVAQLFKRFLLKADSTPFVMELPPYRIPTFKNTLRHMWGKVVQYLQKMGGIILVASIIIWFLNYFPRNQAIELEQQNSINTLQEQHKREMAMAPQEAKDSLLLAHTKILQAKRREQLSFKQKQSFIGQAGVFLEPIIEPLGFNWKAGVAILTGVIGKEIVLSTLGVLYQTGDPIESNQEQAQLSKSIRADKWDHGKRKGQYVFTPIVSLGFMIFILIYFPCIATIIAIKNEAGGWKWAFINIAYTSILAWFLAYATYQIGSLFIS